MEDTKQIRRDMRSVCLCVVGFVVVMTVVSLLVISFGVAIELATDPEFLETVNKYPGTWIDHFDSDFLRERVVESAGNYSGLASIMGMICGLPLCFLIRGKKFLTTDITRRNATPTLSTFIILFVIILGVQFAMSVIQMTLEPLFNSSGGSLTDTMNESTTQLGASFWGILYIVLIGPICEELVFRGAVLRKLEKYGANFAMLTSALLFGLYHVILFQSVFAFLIGLVFAYTAGRFSIKWSILLHIMNNGLAVLTMYFNTEFLIGALNFIYLAAFVVTIGVLNVRRDLLRAQKTAGAPTLANIYAKAYISPWLVLYIIACVGSGVMLLGVF